MVWGSDIAAAQERNGRPVDALDAQIAAISRAHMASLATRKTRDFVGTAVKLLTLGEPGTELSSPNDRTSAHHGRHLHQPAQGIDLAQLLRRPDGGVQRLLTHRLSDGATRSDRWSSVPGRVTGPGTDGARRSPAQLPRV